MADIARCRPRTDLGWFLRPLDASATQSTSGSRTGLLDGAPECRRGTVHEPKGVTRDKHGEEGTGDRHQRKDAVEPSQCAPAHSALPSSLVARVARAVMWASPHGTRAGAQR